MIGGPLPALQGRPRPPATMTQHPDRGGPAAPPDTLRIEGLPAFRQAVRDVLGAVAQIGCRELLLCDSDYADWPLGEPAVIESLQRWALPHRRLVLLASEFDTLARRHPRWVAWRRGWSHIVDCRALPDISAEELPSVLLAPGLLVLRRIDRIRHRAVLDRGQADLLREQERLHELQSRSVPAFPVTTLGL